jgi:putative two-component system response regulator
VSAPFGQHVPYPFGVPSFLPETAVATATPPVVLGGDDDARNRRLLAAQLEVDGYAIVEAGDGRAALGFALEREPDLVLLDVMMPDMDGYEVLRQFKKTSVGQRTPVVLVTALTDRESRLRGLHAGASDFLTKPVDRTELRIRARNLLHLKHFAALLADRNRSLETRVQERTEQLRASTLDTIMTLSLAAEYKDNVTGAHVRRVSHYTKELALEIGCDAEFAEMMFQASPMHDIGKMAVPDAVLLKQGPLDEDEWALMKSHTTFGWNILKVGSTPLMQFAAEIALSHHERWDGSGYPHGTRGDAIPLSARIMSLCDQYDALRSQRHYKRPLGHTATVAVITEGDGRTAAEHFDPAVLAGFMRIESRFAEVFGSFEE